MAEIYLLVGIFAALALYGVFKYSSAETNDYNQVANTTMFMKTKLQALEKRVEDHDSLSAKLFEKVSELEVAVEEAQDHCAKLRESNLSLREQLSRKRPVLSIKQPIPVDVVVKPPKDVLKKASKQIKELSK